MERRRIPMNNIFSQVNNPMEIINAIKNGANPQ
jgi:hypothetical protein